MIIPTCQRNTNVETRARLSQGASSAAIYQMVAAALNGYGVTGDLLVEVGCETGNLWQHVRLHFRRYLGLDPVRYETFPEDGQFITPNLHPAPIALPDAH